MRLTKLSAKNFRSLKEASVSFDPLTVLIGENDAGKSSLLDLLEISLNNKRPDEKDFYQYPDGTLSAVIEVELQFTLDSSETLASQYAIGDSLRVKKVYSLEASETFFLGRQPADETLRGDFGKLTPDQQKALIKGIDPSLLSTLTNATQRANWLENYSKSSEQIEAWITASQRWGDFLPRFERYGAMDYNAPEGMVFKTLRQVYEQVIYETVAQPDGTVTKRPIESLRNLEKSANDKLQDKVSELLDFMRRYDLRINQVRYDPVIDFVSGLKQGEFLVDTGRGLHYLSKTGAGTRRRMFMATLDWDRQVTLQQSSESPKNAPNIIRGYDEPDSNLHYEAQRLMYQAIADVANSPNSRIQAILCTHSLTMIDRAPTKSIRKLTLDQSGCTKISQICTDEDSEIEIFLDGLAKELGITNSLIFYERCFVLVEGKTEKNALPIFYKRIHSRSLYEDGIRVIDVEGNGAVKEFLKLLSRNRKELTLIFIDSDIKHKQPQTARLTEDVLLDAGFDDEFIKSRMIYVGTDEFEDAFPDQVLANCLDKHYPKNSSSWTALEINSLRTDKFSKNLETHVQREARIKFNKAEFGKHISTHCPEGNIPDEIKTLFDLARQIALGE